MPIFTSSTYLARSDSSKPNVVDDVCTRRRSQRLFKRCENPTLPSRHPIYSQAKRLEFDGDVAGALEFLYRAMLHGERVDSCLKDIAGLLNMIGRTREAVEFLRAHSDKVVNRTGYVNLLAKLQIELDKESSSDIARAVSVTVLDRSLGPVTLALCDRLFPNPAKIRRILYIDEEGFSGIVHFATHSSAQKALQIHKLCDNQVACSWSDSYFEVRLRSLEMNERSCLGTGIQEKEILPPHLAAFGGIDSILIYRESDPSLPPLCHDDLKKIEFLKIKAAEVSLMSPDTFADTRAVKNGADITPRETLILN
jgi:hypothetical protein